MSELIQHSISSEIAEVAVWLVQGGFPFDYHSTIHPTDDLLQAVIQEWAWKDKESFDDYAFAIEQECGYVLDAVADFIIDYGEE